MSFRPNYDQSESSSSSKKANGMLGFIKRNLRQANRTTTTNAYCALVRPHLEYCSTVWNPHTACDTAKIEAVPH